MKLVKSAVSLMMAIILFITTIPETVHALADAAKQDVTVLKNDFVVITVDNDTGRYGIRTVEGQPVRKKDQNVNMLFAGDNPESSFTTFKIDGTDYIFGNPYKFGANFFSETTKPVIVSNPNGTRQIETVWSIKGVQIKQILMLYTDSKDLVNAGNVNIRYEVTNTSGANVEVGSRIMLDTMVGGNDGPQFQIGTASRAPLMVERKLVHDPASIGIPEEDTAFYKLPSYWVMRDKLDLDNPMATNVVAYGFNNFAENNINIVDEMIVGHWNGLANTKWDYTPNGNLDFTRDTNDYGTADSAVAFYWNPDKIAPKASQTFETIYGLGEIIAPDKVFSIRYVDQVQQMALKDKDTLNENGLFDITAEVENLPAFNQEHSKVEVELTLQSGLSFAKLDESGKVVMKDGLPVTESYRSKVLEFRKTATPEEAEKGIQPKYKPGDTVTASFKVVAKGKPWPVTREYMLTARSPETRAAIEGVKDDSIKAQYEASKSNFILLPAVGEAVRTYAYGLSPTELFSTDIKYITLNLSNIEAYNTGNAQTPANFDLYLKEIITGKRYKVPVQDSVLIQPTDDGLTGDMRITYRGGDEVDAAGQVIQAGLGPELPLGEYQVELDYKGGESGDEDAQELYDVTTDQTFVVSDNEETRIREANILALYKENVDLSGAAVGQTVREDLLEQLNSLFPGEPFTSGSSLKAQLDAFKKTKALFGVASKAVDPGFDLAGFMDDESLKEVPLYNYQLFETDEELEEFEEEEGADREVLVVIRGMIKQVGTGAEQQVVVDTQTEPAIINEAVAYKGKDMVFVRGKLDIFNVADRIDGYENMPFLDTLFIKGDGTLSVDASGFIFHEGEWTLDFFNGFNKSSEDPEDEGDDEGDEEEEEPGEEEGGKDGKGGVPDSKGNPEDDSQNGSLKWAVGGVGDRLNPLRQVMLEPVYFNKHSLFAAPSFNIEGFGLTFNDFILRNGGISFGGSISLKVLDAEINNVVFNNEGFYGIDAALKFDLMESMGLFAPKKKENSKVEGASGEINITHYVEYNEDHPNQYGLKFDAELKNMLEVGIELGLKQVADGRVLPDVIGFSTTLPEPGILVTGATYLTAVRGAVRELADTIAGGSSSDPFPLTVEAGVGMRFGITPAYFFGDVDLTVKRTGLKIEGKLDFSTEPSGEELMPMLTKALLEAQWVTPWFVRVEAEVDIGGWDVIIGKAGIFVGQNLEKNRTDFEGYIGSRVQIPSDVPIVGGMPLSSVFFGINNDKVWGSIGVLFISLGITYYWGGGIEFGTSSDNLPDGLVHLVVNDPDLGPRLMVIGEGATTVATSWIDTEELSTEITYHEVEEGVQTIESDAMNMGVGGIESSGGGRVHSIPMGGVSGNGVIEVRYDSKEMPKFTLKNASGELYPVVFDNTNTNPKANAFTQVISSADSADGTDIRRAYILIKPEDAVKGGVWTLTAEDAVETKLLNIPTAPKLNEIKLAKNTSSPDKFTASWKVENAKEGDTINLYLSEEPVTNNTSKLEDGTTILEPGDAGMLIAKGLPVAKNGGENSGVTSGSTEIDVTQVTMMGGTEDIRGLLRQGDYYLRAELSSQSTFATKTSAEKFEIIDPLAPGAVSDVKIEPAGNGLFALSFKPAAHKAGHEGFEHSYVIEALRKNGEKLESYSNFGEVLFTEDELKPYFNEATGHYEDIPVGGWTANTPLRTEGMGENGGTGLAQIDFTKEEIKYTGLEVGGYYTLGVSAATKPTAAKDPNENYHYAEAVNSLSELLPVPKLPKLTIGMEGATVEGGKFYEVTTSKTEQTVELSADQNVEVTAYYNNEPLLSADGKPVKTTVTAGAKTSLPLGRFQTDGRFAVELRARSLATRDVSVTMMYLNVDTLAPVLYLEQPTTGQRTENGSIAVAGSTSADTELTVAGTKVEVAKDGSFNARVPVPNNGPTAELQFVAKDKAGNRNSATVSITNGGFEAPAELIVKPIEKQPGESAKLEVSLRSYTGKDQNGNRTHEDKPVALNDPKLSYTLAIGDTAELANGVVTGTGVGSNLIRAEYEVAEGVTLEGMAVASFAYDKPVALGTIAVSASPVSGNSAVTRLTVNDVGDMTGQQLSYKVYHNGTPAELPAFEADLSSWELLPANGIIPAYSGDILVVAKRTSSGKLAMAASGLIPAQLWGSRPYVPAPPTPGIPGTIAGGGGGGGGGAAEPAKEPAKTPEGVEVTVNGKAAVIEWSGADATIHVTADSAGTEGDVVAATTDRQANSFTFKVDRAVIDRLIQQGRSLILELPQGRLEWTADRLKTANGDLTVTLGKNSQAGKDKIGSIVKGLGASVLAAGEGMTLTANVPEASWTPALKAAVNLPDGTAANKVTAVVLLDETGSWTTLPFKAAGTDSALEVQLTGPGSLFFLSGSKTFKDVPAGHWAANSVAAAAAKLIVLGKSSSAFDPNSKVTRAEYPTILLRAAGLMNRSGEGSYADVKQGSWYERSVSIATKLGIVNGTSGGAYSPQAALTRMEAMAMAGRLLESAGAGEELSDAETTAILAAFEDRSTLPAWARKPVALSIKNGIILGENNRIQPKDALTRAQAAAIAIRLEEFLTK